MDPGTDVVVIGAGIAGCVTAMLLAEAGVGTVVVDRGPVAGEASGVNAGMIDSTGERDAADFDTRLKASSVELFEELQVDRGHDIGFRRSGCLTLIATTEELAWAADRVADVAGRGGRLELVDSAALRRLEPQAAPDLLGALYSPIAAQADPVPTTQAFAFEAERAGARFLLGREVTNIVAGASGFVVHRGAHTIPCDRVVLAAGAWCAPLALTMGVHVPIVPVRGQMWAVAGRPGELAHTISAAESALQFSIDPGVDPPNLTHRDHSRVTRHVYGRQRVDGEIVFGGDRVLTEDRTVERDGYEVNRSHVERLLPFLAGRRRTRIWSGLMPFSRSGEPVIGPAAGGPAGCYVVGGLASSGFNRGPGAARLLVDMMLADS